MKLSAFYASPSPVVSFELFPPNTQEGLTKLEERLPKLIALEPSFLTVTYGALGTTQDRTLELASKIKNSYGMEVAHHLTCVGSTQADISRILDAIRQENIENIVALRGDPPQGQETFEPPAGGYRHGNELVEHIRGFGGFGVAVAGYPEAHVETPDFETDLRNLKRKVDAGADVIITQLFYNNQVFYHFVDRCRALGITQPIVPGLLPILNLQQIQRITQMCGSSIPDALHRKLTEAGEDRDQVRELGIEHTVGQTLDLLRHGVSGIHFYVLNQYFHIAEIMEQIRPALRKKRDS
ncbi:MAG: methylenetetrahydrofolate reductase [NAD(P)H], partial [Acidobacteriota bacterium]